MNWKKMIRKGQHYELAYECCFNEETIKQVCNFLQGEPLEMFKLFVEEAKAYYTDQINMSVEEKKTLPEQKNYYYKEMIM